MNRKPFLISATAILLAILGAISCTRDNGGPSLSDEQVLLIAMAASPSYPACGGTITSPTQIQLGKDYKYSIGSGQICFYTVPAVTPTSYHFTLSSSFGNQPLYVMNPMVTPTGSHITDSSWSTYGTSSTDPGQSYKAIDYSITMATVAWIEVDGSAGVFTLRVN